MDKPIPKSVIKRHIKSNGCDIYEHGCLYCKQGDDMGDTLDFSELSPVESGDIEQTVRCTKCGRKWVDVYRLAEVREIV